jgi:hypothetical protein
MRSRPELHYRDSIHYLPIGSNPLLTNSTLMAAAVAGLERVNGIEPSFSAWEADGVPACKKVDTHDLALGDCFGLRFQPVDATPSL